MSTVGEVRALLAAFAHSEWREVHLRSGGWALFMGKPGAGANPLRAATPTATDFVTAPHLGTFHARRVRGERVAGGEVIGTLAVLDRAEDVVAPVGGTLVELPEDGALVEYGARLAAIAA